MGAAWQKKKVDGAKCTKSKNIRTISAPISLWQDFTEGKSLKTPWILFKLQKQNHYLKILK